MVQGYMVTDARSLYDHLTTTLMARCRPRGLTKRTSNPLWAEFSSKGPLSLKETAEEATLEQRRRDLRRAQRERRKKRFEDGGAAQSRQAQQVNTPFLGCV